MAINEAVHQPVPDPALACPPAFDSYSFAATRPEVDLRTLAVAIAVFGGLGVLTWFFRELPLWLAAPLTALWLAWYSSLQHETIHHHPTSWRRFNAAIGSLPLALWIPYRIYRVTHRRHHRHGGRDLTDPVADPESFYLPRGGLATHGRLMCLLYRVNCSLAGRLTVGPALSLHRFLAGETRLLLAGNRWRRAVWLRHALATGLVVVWITQVCHIPLLVYCMGVVYPSVALTHLRSFAEHRAHPAASFRTVSVESGRFWSLLFLNNNLHIAHHAHPGVSWHRLPAVWQEMRPVALGRDLVVKRGYADVLRRHGFRPVMGVEAEAALKDPRA